MVQLGLDLGHIGTATNVAAQHEPCRGLVAIGSDSGRAL